MQEVEYKEMKYQAKITSKENENYYFYVYYENKKITDTYKKDYVEGKSILNYQKDKIIENIKKKTKTTYKVTITRNLDKYTDSLKNKIITSNNPESLKIYNLEGTITVSKFDTTHIVNTIKALNDNYAIESNDFTNIINDIINKKKSNLLSNYDIDYEYLN